MTDRDPKDLSGSIFDEATEITVVELCRVCAIDVTVVDELVGEGILEPTGGSTDNLLFPYSSVRRTRTAVNLQRDLGLNLAGAALALDLLDRIEDLRSQLRRQ